MDGSGRLKEEQWKPPEHWVVQLKYGGTFALFNGQKFLEDEFKEGLTYYTCQSDFPRVWFCVQAMVWFGTPTPQGKGQVTWLMNHLGFILLRDNLFCFDQAALRFLQLLVRAAKIHSTKSEAVKAKLPPIDAQELYSTLHEMVMRPGARVVILARSLVLEKLEEDPRYPLNEGESLIEGAQRSIQKSDVLAAMACVVQASYQDQSLQGPQCPNQEVLLTLLYEHSKQGSRSPLIRQQNREAVQLILILHAKKYKKEPLLGGALDMIMAAMFAAAQPPLLSPTVLLPVQPPYQANLPLPLPLTYNVQVNGGERLADGTPKDLQQHFRKVWRPVVGAPRSMHSWLVEGMAAFARSCHVKEPAFEASRFQTLLESSLGDASLAPPDPPAKRICDDLNDNDDTF